MVVAVVGVVVVAVVVGIFPVAGQSRRKRWRGRGPI